SLLTRDRQLQVGGVELPPGVVRQSRRLQVVVPERARRVGHPDTDLAPGILEPSRQLRPGPDIAVAGRDLTDRRRWRRFLRLQPREQLVERIAREVPSPERNVAKALRPHPKDLRRDERE